MIILEVILWGLFLSFLTVCAMSLLGQFFG